MTTITASAIASALDVYRKLLDSETLAEEMWQDIQETTINDIGAMEKTIPPTRQFYYVLDTETMELGEIVERANLYQRRMKEFEDFLEADNVDPDSVFSWDYFEAAVGPGTWCTMPAGVRIVTNNLVESYAYPTIGEFAADHQLIVVG